MMTSVPEDCYLGNGVDPDEMLHFATFHLSLHCLLKYLFTGFQYTKDVLLNHLSFCFDTLLNSDFYQR